MLARHGRQKSLFRFHEPEAPADFLHVERTIVAEMREHPGLNRSKRRYVCHSPHRAIGTGQLVPPMHRFLANWLLE
jgi:hypothetical protein